MRFRRDNKTPRLFWAGLELPERIGLTSFLVVGVPDSGKTISIRLLMQRVLPRIRENTGLRALIFDPKTEVYSQLVAMGVDPERVLTLNPFDKRGHAWDIAADIQTDIDIRQMALTLFPVQERAPDRYWDTAAADIVQGVLTSFVHGWNKKAIARRRPWGLRDLLLGARSTRFFPQIFAWEPERNAERMEDFVRRLSSDKRARDVVATAIQKVRQYENVAAFWSAAEKENRRLSLETWTHDEKVLILGHSFNYPEVISPINRVLFHRASQLLLDKPNIPEDDKRPRTWVFVDELRELAGKRPVEGLRSLLNEGRSKGVAVVLGFQAYEGLEEAFGQLQAAEIAAIPASKLILKLAGTNTPYWAERLFGSAEILEGYSSRSVSDHGVTRSHGEAPTMKPLVIQSQFMELDAPDKATKRPLLGFAITPGVGVHRVKLPSKFITKNLAQPTREQVSELNFQPRDRKLGDLEPWTKEERDLLELREPTEAETSADDKTHNQILRLLDQGRQRGEVE